VSRELQRILDLERKVFSEDNKSPFDYPQFRQALSRTGTVLYLADNAEETVFDRILIEEINFLFIHGKVPCCCEGCGV
jgi:uncharacterized protein with ATP-grasp and redox domains